MHRNPRISRVCRTLLRISKRSPSLYVEVYRRLSRKAMAASEEFQPQKKFKLRQHLIKGVADHQLQAHTKLDLGRKTEKYLPVTDKILEAKHHFRTAVRESAKNTSTWVCQDQSGDYDPNRRLARPVPLSRRKRERVKLSDSSTWKLKKKD